MSRRRLCPLCQARAVPDSEPCCDPCWRILPPRHRRELLSAWNARIVSPARWPEALAAALPVWRERAGPRPPQ